MTVTEFDNDEYCVSTDGTYVYIRCYLALMQEQEVQFTYELGTGCRILFSIVDKEMGKNTSDFTTNVFYDSNNESGSTVTYTAIDSGKHYVDIKIISSNSSSITRFKPTGINIRQKLISQVYASLDAMNADLSQAVGTYGFLYSLTNTNMVGVYRFDGEKWVEKLLGDYTGTVTPQEYEELNSIADELNGEVITE